MYFSRPAHAPSPFQNGLLLNYATLQESTKHSSLIPLTNFDLRGLFDQYMQTAYAQKLIIVFQGMSHWSEYLPDDLQSSCNSRPQLYYLPGLNSEVQRILNLP